MIDPFRTIHMSKKFMNKRKRICDLSMKNSKYCHEKGVLQNIAKRLSVRMET